MSYSRETRAEQGLDRIIETIEALVSAKPLTSTKALERMVHELYEIRRSIRKLDKHRAGSKERFWCLSRRAVRVSVKIMNLLSKA